MLPWWVRGFDGSRRSSAVLKDLTSQLIGRFCAAVEAATHDRYGRGPLTRYAADLVVPTEVTDEIVVLKGVAAVFVMAAADRASEYEHQQQLLAELVDALRERGRSALERPFALDYADADSDVARLRVVVDQVASLTDESALVWHARLTR